MRLPASRDRAGNPVRIVLAILLFASWLSTAAAHPAAARHRDSGHCAHGHIHDHVREQFAEYVPRSVDREYFGYIYLAEGKVASAVVSGRQCRARERCVIDTIRAARAIPKRATLLGEWHTHPGTGSRALSADDVRGARHHRHIRCYQAYYSTPQGDIYAWDVRQSSVPTAMATRVHLGSLSSPLTPDQRWRLAHVRAPGPQQRVNTPAGARS